MSLHCMFEKMLSHAGRIGLTFLHCVFSNESSNRLLQKMQSHTSCTFLVFSIVCFQMWTRIACLRRCIVTLVAFLWLFSTVCFHMGLQIACIREAPTEMLALLFGHCPNCDCTLPLALWGTLFSDQFEQLCQITVLMVISAPKHPGKP